MISSTMADTLVSAPVDSNLISIGVQITWLGLAAVFAGLLVLALLLPVLRRLVEPKKTAPVVRKGEAPAASCLTPEEVAAITSAVHAHFVHLDREHERKMTWQDHEKPYSPWRLAGRAKMLLARTGIRLRDRRS